MRSMTGCGRCQLSGGAWEATVELRAVNHRFLDVSCRLPRSLSFLEDKLRKRLALTMKRGHVDVFVTVNRVDGGSRVQAAVFADVAAHDLTGRTAHYKKITGGGVRSLQQFPGSLRRLLGNQIKIQCF